MPAKPPPNTTCSRPLSAQAGRKAQSPVALAAADALGFPHLVRTWEAEGPDAAQRWLRRIAQGQGLLAGACCAVALPLSSVVPTMPSGWRNSALAPWPSAIGRVPMMAAKVVIMMGRKRRMQAR